MDCAITYRGWKRTRAGWKRWNRGWQRSTRLKRKYGQSIARGAELSGRSAAADRGGGERRRAHGGTAARAQRGWRRSSKALGGELTARRRAAARKLEKRVEAELAQLAMERTVFRIEIAAAPWSADGADRVEFLVSPNVGEEPRALEKVASGGEISRIALALKTCLAGAEKRDGAHAGLRRGGCRRGRQRGGRSRAALEEAGRRQPGIVRDASAADRVVRGSPLPGGEARIEGTHGGRDGRVGWRRADARDGANALGTEAHRRSAATRRTTNSTERPLVPTAVLPPVRHDILP